MSKGNNSTNSTSLDDIADAISGLATHMDERFEQVNGRLDKMDGRIDTMDGRLDTMDGRLDKMDGELAAIRREQREMREWIESIDNRLGGLESDIAEIYDRIVVLEAKGAKRTKADLEELQTKLDRLIGWATKVSKQTGVALPKL